MLKSLMPEKKNSLSPPVVVRDLDHNDKKFFVVRDDLLPGGTKQRACVPLLEDLVSQGYSDFYYASPFAGFAQVALAYTCQQLNLKCVLFCEHDRTKAETKIAHEFTILAESFGAKIHLVASLDEAESECQREQLQVKHAYKIPLGFNCEPFLLSFEKELRKQWLILIDTIGFMPSRIWLPVGSGTLISIFEKVIPQTTKIIGVDVKVLNRDDSRIVSIYQNSRLNLFSAPEYFQDKADLPPQIPSNLHYDAKVWQFLMRYGKDKDLWWNVAK